MRGRAIRTQKNKPNKTGNIWHLVCLDPTQKNGGVDFQTMKRRFRSFYGISFDHQPTLENGISRFQIPTLPLQEKQISTLNQNMKSHAAQRSLLQKQWEEALKKGVQMREEIQVPPPPTQKQASRKQFIWKSIDTLINKELHMIMSLPFLVAIILAVVGTNCVFNYIEMDGQ